MAALAITGSSPKVEWCSYPTFIGAAEVASQRLSWLDAILCQWENCSKRRCQQQPWEARAMPKARSLVLVAALISALPYAIAAADPPHKGPENVTWSTGRGFAFGNKPQKTRESLSGIACPPTGTARRCIAAFDEGVEAWYVTIDKTSFTPEADRVVLLVGGEELDAEGAARDGNTVYVTGSHSPTRKPCAPRPDSRHAARFRVDEQTGKARLTPGGVPADIEDDKGNLWTFHEPQ
jgi:hypothetical protein